MGPGHEVHGTNVPDSCLSLREHMHYREELHVSVRRIFLTYFKSISQITVQFLYKDAVRGKKSKQTSISSNFSLAIAPACVNTLLPSNTQGAALGLLKRQLAAQYGGKVSHGFGFYPYSLTTEFPNYTLSVFHC